MGTMLYSTPGLCAASGGYPLGEQVDPKPISAIAAPEDLWSAVLECSTDGIVLVDSEGTVREWSQGAARIWGYRRDQVVGRDRGTLIGGHVLGPASDTDSVGAQQAIIHRQPGGESVPVLIRTHGLRDDGGQLVGEIKIVRDMTEEERGHLAIRNREHTLSATLRALRQSHEQLKSAQLQLIQAAKLESIGRLAAGVAHEVKNPLAILLTGIQLLQRRLGSAGPEMADLLGDLETAVKRANGVIRGLLDFAASIELNPGIVDLEEVVSSSVAFIQHELQKRHIQLALEHQSQVPRLRLDRAKIEQILINLMMNAMDAMAEGGTLTVRTSVRQLAEQGHGVGYRSSDVLRIGQTVAVVEIEDTGPGIPLETLMRVFDPFFTTKPAGHGTGLGLAVCRTIAGLHRGSIWLENKSDGGTRATLWLPAGESQKGDAS